jgi:3-phenylpropionate/cinnamic acid dioxygenase small subunit
MQKEKIEQFLYEEARLMDEHRYSEWLNLWDDDAIYWVPSGGEGNDPTKEVSIIYDNRAKLNDRVARFLSGDVLAQIPPRPMRRIVSNIQVEKDGPEDVTVGSNFILVQAAIHEQIIWAGRSTHRLRQRDGRLVVAFKKVVLVNNNIEMPILQFLV